METDFGCYTTQETTSFLAYEFRSNLNKDKKHDARMDEAVADVGYPTGFLGFDFMNGIVVHVNNPEKKMKYSYNSLGIVDGSANTIIGRSGCGKSTLIVQMGANIIRKYKTSSMFHDDVEGGMVESRIQTLAKMNAAEFKSRYIYRNTGITAENFYQRIKMIHDIKLNNRDKYEYDTGLFDSFGNRIFKFEPTIYILDSIAMLMPDKITEEEELSGQMSATGAAKTNTRIFKQIVPLLKSANIILLVVNHILDDVQINPFAKSQSQVSYLKQGERLPGGKAAIYLANNMIRLDDTKLKPDKGYNIYGSIVNLSLVKSRTNKSGLSIPLVYNYDYGYDPELSLFELLKQYDKIGGSGVSQTIGNCTVKFSQKTFKEKLHSSPELQQEFVRIAYEILETFLSGKETNEYKEEDVFDINSMILNYNPVDLAA